MKTLFTFLIVLFCGFAGFAQNGFTCSIIPNTIQASPFTAANSKIAIDNNGKKLFCSRYAGLIVFDGVNYSNYTTTNSGIASNITTTACVDGNNNYWIACADSGLSMFNGTTWTNFKTSNSNIISNRIKTVYAKNNLVFIGGYNGFSIYNNGVFTNYSKSNSALASDTINDFAYDNSNNLWITTTGGLCKLNGNTITVFNSSNSNLLNNSVGYLFVDGSDLYITPNYRMRNNTIETWNNIFNTPIDLRSNNAFCKGPRGGVLFLNLSGLFEIAQGKIYTYFTPSCIDLNDTLSIRRLNLSNDNITNTVWIKTSGKFFVSFNYNFQAAIGGNGSAFTGSLSIDNTKALDVNQVNALMLNRGDMFWDNLDQKYEVPKGSGKHSVVANSLWIGGIDAGHNLRMAAQTYRQSGNDYWPGPLDTLTGTTDTVTAALYDKIWKVDRFQIEQFKYQFQIGAVQNGTFIVPDDIVTWPARGIGNYTRNMAPFVDVNNNGIYDPLTGGDYPIIKGDQMLYWIYNDNLAVHEETRGVPLKIEVHASAYAYACNSINTSDSVINYTTFYNYKIFNRSSDNLDSCYLGNWTDFDIGNSDDDFVGTNVSNNFMYCYNGDSLDDGNGQNHYGLHPPIMSDVILNGPPAFINDGIDNNNDGTIDEAGEKNLMTNSIFYRNDFSPEGNPTSPLQYYKYLRSIWKDNKHLTYGTDGHTGNTSTNFMFPDFHSDTAGWSAHSVSDGTVVEGCGPFHFPAGSSIDFDFAFVFSRNYTVPYNTTAYYNQAVTDVQKVKAWFDNNNAPSCLPIFIGIGENKAEQNSLLLFPNPTNNTLQIRFKNSIAISSLQVYDMLGKEIKTINYNSQFKTETQLDVSNFSKGVYFIAVKNKENQIAYSKFAKE